MSHPQQLFDLAGRVALVTGSSSGIGKAIAGALAEAGAAIVLVARRQQELTTAVDEITAAGGKAIALAFDVAQRDRMPELARQAALAFGPIDILVNAAGINMRQPWTEITSESWDAQLNLNLAVPFFLARELIPPMQARGWGRVINIASLQSVRAFPNSIPYGASKGGIMQLTRAMAEAWSASGINCNAIGPGFFPTELTASVYADARRIQALADQTMIGRNGELSDFKGIAVFLASRASDYITGQTIFLDGGFTAK